MASSKPLPGSPSMALAGTRTSSNTSEAGPHSPMVGIGSDFQPMSRSTMKQVMPASGTTANTITKSASLPLVMNVFSPLMT
jgi:hypothetical protein